MSAPLALSMGDPAGIGPEICIKALTTDGLAADVVVVGEVGCLQRCIDDLGAAATLNPIDRISDRAGTPETIDVVSVGHLTNPRVGQVSAACGAASATYIGQAVERILKGELRGLVTAPINKEALSAAGIRYPGHTEILARLSGVEHVAMMLCNHELRVVLVTVHVPLQTAIDVLEFDAELRAIRMAASTGPAFGFDHPRIAVAGLNPHAGEGGMFGHEDHDIIAPAINAARAEGIDASGPWPGDTVFMRARQGDFDLVVAQYHDQGLIPVKYLGIEHAVNVTLGLPFVRTSVDHGTAFAIAGKGRASAASLVAAIRTAEALAEFRSNTHERLT